MPGLPVTQQVLDRFSPGDQFHIFWPGEDLRIVAEITKLEIRPEINSPELRDDIPELYVEYKDAVACTGNTATKRPEYFFYQERLRDDIFVAREEDGYAEIANVGAEQILFLIKPQHRAFFREHEV